MLERFIDLLQVILPTEDQILSIILNSTFISAVELQTGKSYSIRLSWLQHKQIRNNQLTLTPETAGETSAKPTECPY